MNEAQKATLEKLPGWEVQKAGSAYLRIGYILPDGRLSDMAEGPATEVVPFPEGTVIIGFVA